MSHAKRRWIPSPAMAVALVALFVALTTSAWAVTTLPRNSVGSRQLRTGAVTAPKLGKRAVTSTKIANGTVTTPKIAAGAVTRAKLGAGAVEASNLAANTLTGAQIDESSLGAVPNADTVGGVAPSGLVAAGRMDAGDGSLTATTPQTLLELPSSGMKVTTDGDADTMGTSSPGRGPATTRTSRRPRVTHTALCQRPPTCRPPPTSSAPPGTRSTRSSGTAPRRLT